MGLPVSGECAGRLKTEELTHVCSDIRQARERLETI